jgi:hypothetical protein
MLGWLRSHQPGNLGLAILYWTALSVFALFALFLIFYFVVDPLLPAMF